MLQAILSALAPHLLELVGVIVTLLLGIMTREAKRRWGIEIEAKHREALHLALMTGARVALMKDETLSAQDVASAAVAYAKRSVPDAMNALKPRADVLVDLATARAKDVMGWR